MDARSLPWARSLSPSRHRPLPGVALLGEDCVMLHVDRPLVSRVREIRMHGLVGGPDSRSRPSAASGVRIYQ